jgi:hypothetical protein
MEWLAAVPRRRCEAGEGRGKEAGTTRQGRDEQAGEGLASDLACSGVWVECDGMRAADATLSGWLAGSGYGLGGLAVGGSGSGELV